MQPRLAITRKNITLNARPSQALKADVKAIGVEFEITKPGRYEIVLDTRDDSVELFQVPIDPADNTEAAARKGYELEAKGDFFLTHEERRWIEERRKQNH